MRLRGFDQPDFYILLNIFRTLKIRAPANLRR